MGKAKKGKKNLQDDEVESDEETDITSQSDKKGRKENIKNKTKEPGDSVNEDSKKIKKKKGKQDDDSDIEKLANELEELDVSKKKTKQKKSSKKQISDDEESDAETENVSKKKTKSKANNKSKKQASDHDDSEDEASKKKQKGKKAKKQVSDDSDEEATQKTTTKNKPKGGFALLEVESEPDIPSPPASDEDEEESQTVAKKSTKKSGKQNEPGDKKDTGGKKSKKKKKRDDSDEDLEKVLAELELEYSGTKKEDAEESIAAPSEPETKKEKKKTKQVEKEATPSEKAGEDDAEEHTIKTAAQKKKEKKEREKAKKLAAKKEVKKQDSVEDKSESISETKEVEEPKKDDGDDEGKDEEGKDDKKKKKGAKDEKDKGKAKKGPGSKAIAAMQEALKKMKEDEEKFKKEEEERIKREEEAEQQRLELIRLEQERKERKKQKEKERKERLKAEGKLLSSKQKADRARAQAMIEALKAQGLDMPDVGEKRPRPGTRVRPNKLKKESSQEKSTEEQSKSEEQGEQEEKVEVQIVDQPESKKEEDDVKDAWDADSSDDEPSDEVKGSSKPVKHEKKVTKQESVEESESESESEESEDEDDDDEEGSDESEDEVEKQSDAERKRAKALARIQKRREEAEKNKTPDDLRAAVVCVLGHVDTGKTKILDKLRRTNVQDSEAGGITQQIGATNVPMENIKEQTRMVKGFAEKPLLLPGLLIIDTPGHESFSNLRSRGSSLCDIAILVVDIMHGLEPQTLESINLLKQRRTPFVVALNKIDRLYDWQTMYRKDVRDIIKGQAQHTQIEFENRTKEVVVQFAEQSLNAALFYDNPDPRSYISLVPTSAITGEGMGNLLALIVDMCQSHLAKRLMYSAELQATVLEVKAIPGLGTTIDVILVNGILHEGDTMILAGTEGPVVTQIRSLLMPQPMRELRVKNAYVEYKEIKAAQGVKIAAKELEKAIAGLNLAVAQHPDEVEIVKEEVAKELKSALSSIKLQERGVYVQASTLGSLEALLDFLKTSKIPYAGIRIGPVVKKDVMKASIMLEHDEQYAVILAFDVRIERDAQELADAAGVRIFQADIIYHLFDAFTAHVDELRRRRREQNKHIAVFPCKLRVMPQCVFNSRDPIVCGVIIEAGVVREGTPICVPSKEFIDVGVVTSIESNHKQLEVARKGMEVCIKIDPIPGEAPKMFGRHFDETDLLISKISRQSIDACKDYFRDDLQKNDWMLMVELKKLFQIL